MILTEKSKKFNDDLKQAKTMEELDKIINNFFESATPIDINTTMTRVNPIDVVKFESAYQTQRAVERSKLFKVDNDD